MTKNVGLSPTMRKLDTATPAETTYDYETVSLLETIQRIETIANEDVEIELKKEEIEFGSYEEARYRNTGRKETCAYAAATGELRGKLQNIRLLCQHALTKPLQVAIQFTTAFELELGRRKRLEPDKFGFYKDGLLTVERTNDDEEEEAGYDIIECLPSTRGVKKNLIASIGVVKTKNGWQILDRDDDIINAEGLVDWLAERGE